MRHAKIFSIFVFAAVLCYGAVAFYFLPLASFQGDLTRTGMLPETQFGWRKAQPKIEQQWLTQASIQEADVLVIGDSFSDSRVWQTVLTEQGIKVRTEPWDSMRAICADFMPWLRGQGFHGKYVVIETVERNISDLKKSLSCNQMETHTNVYSDMPSYPPVSSFDPSQKDWSGRLSIGIHTALNYRKYEHLSDSTNFKFEMLPNGTMVVRVNNGCDLFSHTRCNDALFLAQDKAEDVDVDILKDIEVLNTRLSGITPIWVFVPNKSTAYLYPEKQFWNKAEQRLHAPNLLRMTQQAIRAKTIDLYPANNTHFSTTGYLLMGKEILNTMQKTLPQQRLH